jgi:hypothetical protein
MRRAAASRNDVPACYVLFFPNRTFLILGIIIHLDGQLLFRFFWGVPVRLFFMATGFSSSRASAAAMAAAFFALLEVVEARGDMRRDKTEVAMVMARI